MKRNPLGFGWFGCVALTVAASFFAPSAYAVTRTWSGGSGSWGTPGNWSQYTTPTTAPLAGEDVVFSGTGGIITAGNPANARNVEMASGSYTFNISSGSSRSFILDTFSGAALANTIFTSSNASSVTWVLSVSGTTAFTGSILNNTDGNTVGLTKTNTGLLDISNATTSYTGATAVTGGVLRISGAASGVGVPTGFIRIGNSSGSGILEINGKGSNVTMSRSLGSGAGQIRLGGDVSPNGTALAGFGAVNGQLSVNLNGGGLVKMSNGSDLRINILQLGSETSTHRVIFQNNLEFTGDRGIRAGDGAAAIDGEFSGTLVFSGTTGESVLTKDGAGTMLLSGTSSALGGRLHVAEGKLLVSGSLASVTANTTYGVKVDAGATLGGGGSIVLSNNATKMTVEGTLQAGDGFADKTLTLSTNLEMAADSILSFAIDGTDQSDKIALIGGTSWLFQANQKVNILDLGISDAGGQFALITGLTGFGSYDFSNWQVTNSGPVTGELVYIGNTLYYQAVPEPSTLAFVGFGLGALVLSFRRRKLA